MLQPLKLTRASLFLTFYVCLLASCKKATLTGPDEDNGNYYMRFTVNGVKKEYKNEAALFYSYSTNDKHYITILGAKKSGNSKLDQIVANINSKELLAAGKSYLDKTFTSDLGDKSPELFLGYTDEKGGEYASVGFFSNISYYSGATVDSKFTVTQFTGKSIRGTFSGTLYKSDLSASVVISGGEFYLEVFH